MIHLIDQFAAQLREHQSQQRHEPLGPILPRGIV